MSAPTKRKKKKKRAKKTATFPEKLKKWETPQSAHPRYVDLDKLFAAIDASSQSEEDKKGEKAVLAVLSEFVDKNGETKLYDDVKDEWYDVTIPRRYLKTTDNN